MPKNSNKDAMFTAKEKKGIRKLLSKAVNPEEALILEELHGFLFGLAITPEMIKPSEWMPVVFGEEMIEYEDKTEASDLLNHFFTVYNRIQKENLEGKLSFPFDLGTLKKGGVTKMRNWTYGLFLAMSLRPELWVVPGGENRNEDDLSEDELDLSACCAVIASIAKPENIPELFEAKNFDPADDHSDVKFAATLLASLPHAVATVQSYGRRLLNESRSVYSSKHLMQKADVKIGRNEPCPCGSGRKFKQCCGMH